MFDEDNECCIAIFLLTIMFIGTILYTGCVFLPKYIEKSNYETMQSYNDDESAPFEYVYRDDTLGTSIMREKTTDTMYIKSQDKYEQMTNANGTPLSYDEWCAKNQNKIKEFKEKLDKYNKPKDSQSKNESGQDDNG